MGVKHCVYKITKQTCQKDQILNIFLLLVLLILPFLINGMPGRIMGNEKRKGRQFTTSGSQVGQQISIHLGSNGNVNDLKEVLGTLGVGSRFNTGGSPSNSFSSSFFNSNSGGSGSGNIQCQTTCQSNGSCKVKIINGPPGPLSGSCFPPDFGGSCSGIPSQCQRGSNIAQQCGTPCQAGTRNA